MKTKNLLLTGLLTLGVLTACSNEDDLGTAGAEDGGTAYTKISFEVANSSGATTRADVPLNTGDEGEYTIQNVTIVFTDNNGVIKYVKEPTVTGKDDETISDNQAVKKVYETSTFSIPATGSYKIYALVNYSSVKSGITDEGINLSVGANMPSEITIPSSSLTGSNNPFANTNDKCFFMVNAEAPTVTTIYDQNHNGTNSELWDATTKTNLVTIEVERVVSKVSFTQNKGTATAIEVKDNDNTKIAEAKILGVDAINLNTKMNLIKEKETTAYPTGTGLDYANLYYVKDPNYTNAIADCTDDAGKNAITADFAHHQASFDTSWDADACYYFLENTMSANAQENGQTTGVVYKVEYVPVSGAFAQKTNMPTAAQAVYNQAVTNGMVDDAWTTKDAAESKTFYVYNNLMFRGKKAVAVYVAATASNATADNVKNAYDNPTLPTSGLKTYENGLAYYPVWIKHNTGSTVDMELGRYGVVRNHWYNIEVEDIKSLGNDKPTYTNPEDPDDPAKSQIIVKVKVMPWRYISQKVTL